MSNLGDCIRLVLLLCASSSPDCGVRNMELAYEVRPTSFVTKLPSSCIIEGMTTAAKMGDRPQARWVVTCYRNSGGCL